MLLYELRLLQRQESNRHKKPVGVLLSQVKKSKKETRSRIVASFKSSSCHEVWLNVQPLTPESDVAPLSP